MYRQMSLAKAKNLKKENKEYNVYHCNLSKANLFRDESADGRSCTSCTYLVNAKKKTIEISELGEYDVIFIQPDAELV